MRPAFVPALLLVLLVSEAARAEDEWFARDKALHFGASAGIASIAYGTTTAFTDRRSLAFGIGFSTALGAGIAKEAWDAAGHGDPSWKDFAWDVFGTLSGLAIAYGIDSLVRPRPSGAHGSAEGGLSFDLRPSTFDPHAMGARATFQF